MIQVVCKQKKDCNTSIDFEQNIKDYLWCFFNPIRFEILEK